MAKKIVGIEIVEWFERYEVSIKGREAKPGDELKAGPLLFIRLKAYGHTQSTGYRRLKSVAGDRTMEVFGFFCKFLEIAGNQKRERRGALLNEKNRPASAEDLSFILDTPLEQVQNAINVLCDEKVGWLKYNNKPNLIKPNLSKEKRKLPETSETFGKDSKSNEGYKSNGDELIALWNSKPRLPKIRTLTDKRRQLFRTRMQESQFVENLPLIIEKVGCSDFLCGTNKRKWKADIDWLLKNDTNYIKILEGRYDNEAINTAPLVKDKDGLTPRERMAKETGVKI